MAGMILDVGCGGPIIGLKPLEGKNTIHIDVRRTAVHIEVQCDVHYLPFQSNGFSTIYASHILEHLNNPIKAIQEMRRVSSKRVIFKVPNASYFKRKNSSEVHIFS
jgi:ubiquinone/menaquinone biosynthesis C-methylase UbiE